MSGYRRKRRRRRQKWYVRYRLLLSIAALALLLGIIAVATNHRDDVVNERVLSNIETDTPDYDVQLLTVNSYSRPGTALEQVNGIVIHYTANPGTSAQANRDYFEGLKDSGITHASSHFIVGLDGEIIQCIPTAEIAYASNERNSDTISIECCYENEDGSFNQATYDEVIHLTAWLCAKFGLEAKDVIRHYDVTGKLCPIYYVEHEDAWEQFRDDVDAYLKEYRKK